MQEAVATTTTSECREEEDGSAMDYQLPITTPTLNHYLPIVPATATDSIQSIVGTKAP